MSLYPSLEEMHVDKILLAQQKSIISSLNDEKSNPGQSLQLLNSQNMYPNLIDFMGLELNLNSLPSEDVFQRDDSSNRNDKIVSKFSTLNVIKQSGAPQIVDRSQVTNGIREFILCKDSEGKVGLRVQSVNTGIFVCIVVKNSPAALAGIRFGDQILELNETVVAGYTVDKIHDMFKKSGKNNISVVVRDRPFERTITLYKDSKGRLGFEFSNGQITSIVKGSSAARNGVLTEYNLLEINDQNVVAMKDKEVTNVIESCAQVVKITVIPSFIYQHMIKKLSNSFLREVMDHNIRDI